MNSSTFLVKVLSEPIPVVRRHHKMVVKVQVQFLKRNKKKSKDQFTIHLWGKMGLYFLKYFRNGDYVIIEGRLSFNKLKIKERFERSPIFTVRRIFPFWLVSEDLISEDLVSEDLVSEDLEE